VSDNISWDAPDFDGWEPWEPDEDPDPRPAGACAYCDATEVRELPEPFGGRDCCETCFARLIGDESDDPEPFRCLTSIRAMNERSEDG
jgi:hypothetical protein